jgi:hypothetical protein
LKLCLPSVCRRARSVPGHRWPRSPPAAFRCKEAALRQLLPAACHAPIPPDKWRQKKAKPSVSRPAFSWARATLVTLSERRRSMASPAKKSEGRSAGMHRRRVSASCRKRSAVGKFAAGETGSGIGGSRPWSAFIRRIDLKHFLSRRPIRPAFPYTAGRPCGTARSGISAPDMRSPVSGLASPVDLGHRFGRKHVDRYRDECDGSFDHCGRDMALDLHHEPTVARIEACWSRRTQRNVQPRFQASQGQHHC